MQTRENENEPSLQIDEQTAVQENQMSNEDLCTPKEE